MQSMNISLPEPMKQFVDSQVAQGRYSRVSEYVRELIRADEKRRAEEQLEALLLEGLRGEALPMTREDWQAIRQEAMSKIQKIRRAPKTVWTVGVPTRWMVLGRCLNRGVLDGGGQIRPTISFPSR